MSYRPNIDPVDLFTIKHVGSGIFWGQFAPLPIVAAGAVAFEILERPAKQYFGKYFPVRGQDTMENSIMDVVAVVAGAYVSQKFHAPYFRERGWFGSNRIERRD